MMSFGPRRDPSTLSIRSTGAGPALVLLHGGSGSRTHWARNVKALSQHFEVITPDLPGFGESASPADGISAADYLETVACAVSEVVAAQPFHLVGFSFGGAVAAAVSARLAERGLAPQRLSLISPAGFGRPDQREITLEKVKGLDDPQALREATARNLGCWMLARAPQPHDAVIDIHLSNVALSRFDSRRISHQDSLIGDVRAAGVPTQILLGEQDPLIFPSLSQRLDRLARELPAARVEVVADAGHWLGYEASEHINRGICRFHLRGDNL